MLLRQALEQIRAGKPTPVLFNSSIAALDHIDEVSAMAQKEVTDVRVHTVRNRASSRSLVRGSAGQARQGQPHRKTATAATGAQAS
jgi:hypothetical protein